MLEQVVNRDRRVVVRIHQPGWRHDTVTVIVRSLAKAVELVTQRQQTGHSTLRGAVHADHAVFIEVHKAEGLINLIVNDSQVKLVERRNTFPVFDTGTAQRINAQFQARFLDSRHIDDIGQPFDKRLHQILLFHVTGCQCGIQRNAFHTFQAISQQRVRAIFNHFGHVGISRATVWRIVFDTAIFRWVM